MIHQVVAATGRADFTVELEFADGERAEVDLSDFVVTGEVTAPLRPEPRYFVSALRVLQDGGAIGWPGDVEIDADALLYKTHPDDWQRDYGGPPQKAATASDEIHRGMTASS